MKRGKLLLFLCIFAAAGYAQKNFAINSKIEISEILTRHIFASSTEVYQNIKIVDRSRFEEMKTILNLLDETKGQNLIGGDYVLSFDNSSFYATSKDNFVTLPADTAKKLPARTVYSSTDCPCALKSQIKRIEVVNGQSAAFSFRCDNKVTLSKQPTQMERYLAIFSCKAKLYSDLAGTARSTISKLVDFEFRILDVLKVKGAKAKSVVISGGEFDCIDTHQDYFVYKKIEEDVDGQKFERLVKVGVLDLKDLKPTVTYADVDEGQEEILKLFNEKVPLIVKKERK